VTYLLQNSNKEELFCKANINPDQKALTKNFSFAFFTPSKKSQLNLIYQLHKMF
jgi:hypothetical protein